LVLLEIYASFVFLKDWLSKLYDTIYMTLTQLTKKETGIFLFACLPVKAGGKLKQPNLSFSHLRPRLASLEISRAKSTSQENRQLPPKSESILRACVSVLVHSGC
jgi:hypothetical protein